MHVVIDRLGASGRMMQIHPAKTINPKSLRALQVETAAEYGIALNDTPRVSRGHRERGLSSPEWRAEQRGERRDRSPTRQVYAKTASSFADDAIGREANELKKLADRYQSNNTPKRRHEAKALERAAFILSSGGTLDDYPLLDPEREASEAETVKETTTVQKQSELFIEQCRPVLLQSPALITEALRAAHQRDRADIEEAERSGQQLNRERERDDPIEQQDHHLGPRLTEETLRELVDRRSREIGRKTETERSERENLGKSRDRGEGYGY